MGVEWIVEVQRSGISPLACGIFNCGIHFCLEDTCGMVNCGLFSCLKCWTYSPCSGFACNMPVNAARMPGVNC